jgi:hypothetical protein
MESDMTLAKREQVVSVRPDAQEQLSSGADRNVGQTEVQRKRARTFARHQKISERGAAAPIGILSVPWLDTSSTKNFH